MHLVEGSVHQCHRDTEARLQTEMLLADDFELFFLKVITQKVQLLFKAPPEGYYNLL